MEQVEVNPNVLIVPPITKVTKLVDSSNVNLPGEIKLTQSNLLLRSYLVYQGFADDILESYNNWVQKLIFEQMASRPIDTGKGSVVRVTRAILERPTTVNAKNEAIPLTPLMCRNNGSSYTANLSVDLEHVVPGTPNSPETILERAERIHIGKIPVMLGSVLCHLYGKSDQEKLEMGECPNDPLTYFIIKGNEKVILMQENMRLNRFFIFADKNGDMICRMTMITHKGSKIVTLYKGPNSEIKLWLAFMGTDEIGRPNTLPALAPFLILARAYPELELPGSVDQMMLEILSFTQSKNRKKVYNVLQSSFIDLFKEDIEQKILDSGVIEVELRRRLVGNDETKKRAKFSIEQKRAMLYELLIEQLFPHMDNRRIADKLKQLALMIAIYTEFILGLRKADDRDSWTNKRVETAGRMLEHLFTNLWNEFVTNTQAAVAQYNKIGLSEVRKSLDTRPLNETIIRSFEANSWGPSGSSKKANVADNLKRESPLALYSHITLINTPTSRHSKIPSIRMVQMSQLGYVDPVETSEGANCGLVKAKAITAKVTIERDEAPVYELIKGDLSATRTKLYNVTLLLNGKYTGWCDGEALREKLISLRRKGQIYRDTSAVLIDNILYVSTDGARLTRPLLIVDKDGRLTIEKKNLWNAPFYTLLLEEAVEYVDAAEQESILLASSIDSLAARKRELAEAVTRLNQAINDYNRLIDEGPTSQLVDRDIGEELALEMLEEGAATFDEVRQLAGLTLNERADRYFLATKIKMEERIRLAQDVVDRLTRRKPFTHCELDPNSMFGIASSIIPLPDHNQAPRNVYQTAMGKQALGIYHSNYHLRFDTTAKTLAFPTRPLFETQMLSLLGMNQQPIGQMVTVAIMTYGGYNQEDALIFNRASIDRGLFKMQVHRSYKTSEESDTKMTETIMRPELKPGDSQDKYAHLDEHGIARLGARIETGQVIIGKIRYNKTTGKRVNASVVAGKGESGIVSSVLVTKNTTGNRLVRVKITDTRDPIEGDKFASRHAQKATIGLILPEVDMPFSSKGVRPDIIINPHAIPSRMTIAKLIEIVTSKVAALSGERINASAFSNFDIEEFKNNLKQYGYQPSGNEVLYSGYTGRALQSEIFIGPCYYQALRHHVKDKIQMRSRGEVKLLTHQPVGGRSRGGGLRTGEMERDAFISHGATAVLTERLCTSSDAYKAVYCRECGQIAISDAISQQQICRCCGNNAKFGTCEIPYAYRLLQNMLAGAAINMRFKLKEKTH
jgi:DNA-directed RNA polymerase II subunit RPB2